MRVLHAVTSVAHQLPDRGKTLAEEVPPVAARPAVNDVVLLVADAHIEPRCLVVERP